jgi:hypothetical protein
MMVDVQTEQNLDNTPFLLSGTAIKTTTAVIAEINPHDFPLAQFTIMAKVSATGKWKPFVDETAEDGTAIPQGIYVGADIPDDGSGPPAKILEQSNVEIVIGGNIMVAEEKLVLENSKTLDTVIVIGEVGSPQDERTVRDRLQSVGITPVPITYINEYAV